MCLYKLIANLTWKQLNLIDTPILERLYTVKTTLDYNTDYRLLKLKNNDKKNEEQKNVKVNEWKK